MELRDRVCFHDHRLVAHDAVALRRAGCARATQCFRDVSAFETLPSPNHTVVIHQHC
jgi:hypothetical protein